MQKLLLFVLVLCGIFYFRRWLEKKGDTSGAQTGAPVAPGKRVEHVRECRECGILVPESEAVKVEDDYYCGDEHARRHAGSRHG
ncbi:PP0621 family protein [Uliginosibacterium paludis]|uniref:PP0621 family protein n=1 Tax=Uliginosibacterium paludis TaxID=1615952 RepID=A0ABV2CK57_9RHOO